MKFTQLVALCDLIIFDSLVCLGKVWSVFIIYLASSDIGKGLAYFEQFDPIFTWLDHFQNACLK